MQKHNVKKWESPLFPIPQTNMKVNIPGKKNIGIPFQTSNEIILLQNRAPVHKSEVSEHNSNFTMVSVTPIAMLTGVHRLTPPVIS